MDERPRFERIRIQIFFPCSACCKWCRTYLKNSIFAQLAKNGTTNSVNDFYISVLKCYKPRTLAISGGEAILYPGIEQFLRRALKYCEKIHLYTSYQYKKNTLLLLDWRNIPPKRLVLVHSCIHFLPSKWHDLTNGFPHSLYVTNIKQAKELPFKKRVKFVLNHPDLYQEVQEFIRTVKPDSRFELSCKLINEQNNGFGSAVMRETREHVLSHLREKNLVLLPPDENIVSGVANDELLSRCRYRNHPVELRFALWRESKGSVILKVRFCPYFGPTTAHKFHVEVDTLKKIDQWYSGGEYKLKCDTCRLLYYCKPELH